MPDKQLTNPLGAFGYTDLTTELPARGAPISISTTVTAGRCISIGTTGLGAVTATNGSVSLVIGVFSNTSIAPSGASGTILVVTEGYAQASADGTINAGDLLKRSGTTAGYVAATATPAAGEVIGVAIAASASGLVDVWVSKGAN